VLLGVAGLSLLLGIVGLVLLGKLSNSQRSSEPCNASGRARPGSRALDALLCHCTESRIAIHAQPAQIGGSQTEMAD